MVMDGYRSMYTVRILIGFFEMALLNHQKRSNDSENEYILKYFQIAMVTGLFNFGRHCEKVRQFF